MTNATSKRRRKEPEASPPPIILTSAAMDAAWRNILETNIPPETHPDMVKMCKRFFYAGAKKLLDYVLYTDMLDEDTDGPSKSDINRVDAVCHEINQFLCEVAAGRQ